MRLRQIEVFHAIYTTGSISAAARKLHVSQPAISKVLHHTQGQLGLTLFELVRGRLVATEQAHALYREVGEIHERLNALDKAVGHLRQLAGGLLRIATVPSLGQHIMPATLSRLHRAHPDLSIDVQTVHHDDVLRRLLERECELAIVYSPHVQPRLHVQSLATAELMVLAQRSDFPSASALALDHLQGRPMVGLASSGPLGELFDTALETSDIRLDTRITSQTYAIAAALTAEGAGPCVVDEFTARSHAGATLQAHPLTPPLCFEVCCVHLEDRPLSAAAQRFLDYFRQAITALRERSTA